MNECRSIQEDICAPLVRSTRVPSSHHGLEKTPMDEEEATYDEAPAQPGGLPSLIFCLLHAFSLPNSRLDEEHGKNQADPYYPSDHHLNRAGVEAKHPLLFRSNG